MHTVQAGFTAPRLTLALTLTLTLMLPLWLVLTPSPVRADPVVKPPPVRELVQRRSVQQTIEATPRIVTDGDRPTLRPGPPAPTPAPTLAPAPPARLNTCDAGGCFDSSGARFNGGGGVGAPMLGPTGQLCTRGVVNAQCF